MVEVWYVKTVEPGHVTYTFPPAYTQITNIKKKYLGKSTGKRSGNRNIQRVSNYHNKTS